MTHTAKTRLAPPWEALKMTAHVRLSCQAHATTYMGAATHVSFCQSILFEHDGMQVYLFIPTTRLPPS